MASLRVRRLLNLYRMNANGLMDKVDKNVQKQIVKKAEQEKKKQGDTNEESLAAYDNNTYKVGTEVAQEQVIVAPNKTYVTANNLPPVPPSEDFFLEVYEIISDIPEELKEKETVVTEEDEMGEKVKTTTRARKTNDRIKKAEGPKNKTKKAKISYEKKRTGESDNETIPS